MRKVRPSSLLSFAPALFAGEAFGVTDPATVHLTLNQQGTETCLTAQSLANNVERRLNRRVFVEEAQPDLRVSVEITDAPSQIDVAISLNAGTGEDLGSRTLSSPSGDCAKLTDSLALVLALMIDLEREELQARISDAAGKPPSEEPPRTATAAAPSSMSPRPSSREAAVPNTHEVPSHLALALGGVAVTGSLPRLGFGVRGAAEWHRETVSVELGVAAVFPVTAPDKDEAQAAFSQYLADASVCLVPLTRRRIELGLCGGLELGITRAEGQGYLHERTAYLPEISPLVRTSSTWWPTSRFGLRLGVGAKAAVYREQFHVTREDGSEHELFRPAVGAVLMQADVCVKL